MQEGDIGPLKLTFPPLSALPPDQTNVELDLRGVLTIDVPLNDSSDEVNDAVSCK